MFARKTWVRVIDMTCVMYIQYHLQCWLHEFSCISHADAPLYQRFSTHF